MNIILDTHAFFWFINGDQILPTKVQAIIRDLDNKCYLSISSIWEIAIKIKLNKLHLKADFTNIRLFLSENEIELLPITFEHIDCLLNLELHHRDPFDRILISQAIVEKLTVITKDVDFIHYPVNVLWD